MKVFLYILLVFICSVSSLYYGFTLTPQFQLDDGNIQESNSKINGLISSLTSDLFGEQASNENLKKELREKQVLNLEIEKEKKNQIKKRDQLLSEFKDRNLKIQNTLSEARSKEEAYQTQIAVLSSEVKTLTQRVNHHKAIVSAMNKRFEEEKGNWTNQMRREVLKADGEGYARARDEFMAKYYGGEGKSP